jgi:hypothetical protein
MASKPDDHAGSGLDKPDPKTLLEKAKDGIKAVLPKTIDAAAKAAPALQDGTEAPIQK